MSWHAFVAALSDGLADYARQCYRAYPLVRGTVQAVSDLCTGVGILARRVRKEPTIAIDFGRRSCFSVLYRSGYVALLSTAQLLNNAVLQPVIIPSLCYYPHYAIDRVIHQLLLVQYSLFLLEITVIGIVTQREVGREYDRRCPGTRDTLQTTLVRIVTPMLITAVGSLVPLPSLRQIFTGVGLGCQIHDGALATRGVCVYHRVRSWSHEGLFYICVGILLERTLGPSNQFVAIVITAAATMQPLSLKPELDDICQDDACAVPYSILHTPYNFSRQVIERLRRAYVAGAFAPNLTRRVPAATTLLKIYRLSQLPAVQWLLPAELTRPELHYLMADVITDRHLRDALRAVDQILRTAVNRLRHDTMIYLPRVVTIVSGLPPFVVQLIRQILMDQDNIATVHQLQQYLARRYNAVALSRKQPLFSKEWSKLGISPGTARSWGLAVADMQSVWVELHSDTIAFEEDCLVIDPVTTNANRPTPPIIQSLLYDALSASID
jgi:hypothetical protein